MMRLRPPRFVGLALVAAIALVVLAAPARAQDADNEPFHEPNIAYRDHRDPYIQWVAGGLIVVACLVVASKNPHRTHLD